MTVAERAAELMALNKMELATRVAELEDELEHAKPGAAIPAGVVAAEEALHEAVAAAT